MSQLEVELPPKLIPVFSGYARYRCAFGGRGSGKSRSFAMMAAIRGAMFATAGVSGIILCAREFMNSLDDSSMAEVKAAIASNAWLRSQYIVGEKFIRHISGRVEFKFAGLRHNLESIRSKARVLILWIDEAEAVSEAAWRIAEPTIREEQSEIWVTWNPKKSGSPTDKRFRKFAMDECKIVELNYMDNPWFPEVLRKLMETEKKRSYETYVHVWLGGYETRSDSLVFKNWVTEDFKTPDDARFYHGADWGFANDPTALIRCFIEDTKLFIDAEAVAVGCDIEHTPALFAGSDVREPARWKNPKAYPGIATAFKWPIVADSARPETISHMRRKGFNIMPAIKGKDSVEDGVAFLQSYDTIIHPRCKTAVKEFSQYSYKLDPQTEEVLPVLIDEDNHTIDAARYALENLRRSLRKRTPGAGPKVVTA